ncbi:GNAT family N-acetyltransferase [Microvirga thermotolerans]|uniref:GNAT family N-acetyltransferase n=1 Tax=Microvirga thermotolerans TaxID=2651334 RepID=A0A5P9JUQ9_9HYPH|nr:GNAT family N-acetyltransferase [Microvirga thermotolerans]QFU14915.1 GNAT family N-acetyltransferase [Microvirga thermotolerans]
MQPGRTALVLRPVVPEGHPFSALEEASLREGYRMVRRIREEWADGGNRFARPGEILLGAFLGEALAGLCGRTVDPYRSDPRAGRIRRLYVHPNVRRLGTGRRLVETLAADALPFFDVLNVRAPAEAFPFYERLGFARVTGDGTVTHRLRLSGPERRPEGRPAPLTPRA